MMCVKILLVLLLHSVNGRVAKLDQLPEIIENIIITDDIKAKPILLTTEKTVTEANTESNKIPALNIGDNKLVDKNKNSDYDEADYIKNIIYDGDDDKVKKVDNGTALILTPYIEDGRLEEGRVASKVDPIIFDGVKSHSGFLTVNKTYNSNTFFWYFPVEKNLVFPLNETPWIIWLQGGPGASSMAGLFSEIGPFEIVNGVAKRRPYSWHEFHSLVFIDNPVGTGFSFTEHKDGLARDMETYSQHLYSAVSQLVKLFPELQKAPLYIAGESYAGKYVPSLAYELHRHKINSDLDINLQGILIGNAYVDPPVLKKLWEPYYNFGLIDQQELEIINPILNSFNTNLAQNKSIEAKSNWNNLVVSILYLANQKHAYNFMRDEIPIGASFRDFVKTTDFKRAVHVGDINFTLVNITVYTQLLGEFLVSAKPKIETLLEHYRVLAYCGNLDQILPCVSTSENYRTWKWSGSEQFIKASRFGYYYKNRLAGYHKTGGNLTEAIIIGAGHMVPTDKPAQTRFLITKFTHKQTIPYLSYERRRIVASGIEIEPEDNGSPLILTPLIKKGLLNEARNASKVDETKFLGIKSHSGFLTVNQTHNSNSFFWYFPVEQKPVNETPWIIWLQGGPGATSMLGLFEEMGPFTVNITESVLMKNPHSWHRNHSLVFIDNPVGTGFSFTDNPDGYAKDMETYTQHLYSAVSQLVQLFPELQKAPLFVAGESYAGKYCPALALELHRRKLKGEIQVNMQGIILGNALVDPSIFFNFTQPFYHFALLGVEDLKELQPYQDELNEQIRLGDRTGLGKQKWQTLLLKIFTRTGLSNAYNFLRNDLSVGTFIPFLQRNDIRRAIHVGNSTFRFVNSDVGIQLAPDFLRSSKDKLELLLEHYKVLSYCGQLDQMVACVLSSANHRTWKWSNSTKYNNARRRPYMINNRVAGYIRSGGGLSEVMIRGAGHMAASDEPATVRDLVTQWIEDELASAVNYSSPFSGLEVVQYLLRHANKNQTKIVPMLGELYYVR